MKIPPCPCCGDTVQLPYRNVRAMGWCQEYFNLDGTQAEMETSNLNFTNPKKLYCGNCNKVRKDLIGTGTDIQIAQGLKI
jgi:hypothetical protein